MNNRVRSTYGSVLGGKEGIGPYGLNIGRKLL
jgi:hypothetical protein